MIIFCSGQFHSFHFEATNILLLSIYLLIYVLFIYLTGLSCGTWDLHHCCNMWDLFLVIGISGVLSLQRLEVGLRFPSQWLRPGHDDESTQVMGDTGPGPSASQERIPTKMESSKTRKVFTRRKKGTVHVDRHTGSLRQNVPESSLRDSLKSESPSVMSPLRPQGL